MVQGNSTKKDVYDVGTKTIYIGEIVIPPGEYKEKLKKEDDEKLKTEGEYDWEMELAISFLFPKTDE